MPSRGSDNRWSSARSDASVRSYNTGFSRGTQAFRPSYTQHAKDRKLEREIDEEVIRHTVVRGRKTETRVHGQQRWRFEKDGVVVISSSPTPHQHVITTWFEGGTSDQMLEQRANRDYDVFLERLDDALDDDERVDLVRDYFGHAGDKGSPEDLVCVVGGVDRALNPRDFPLIHHCAKNGYVAVVKLLLESGKFTAAIGLKVKPGRIVGRMGRKGSTLLHYVAWHGHADVLDVLGHDTIQNLSDITNSYGWLPETTAWARHCDPQASAESSGAYLRIASICARARAGSVDEHTTDFGEAWFVEEANLLLEETIPPCDAGIKVMPGATATRVASHLAKYATEWRAGEFKVTSVDLSDPDVLWRVLQTQIENSALTCLVLEACQIGPLAVPVLRKFLASHKGCVSKLSLAFNPLGDRGVSELFGFSPILSGFAGLCNLFGDVLDCGRCQDAKMDDDVERAAAKSDRLITFRTSNRFCDTPGPEWDREPRFVPLIQILNLESVGLTAKGLAAFCMIFHFDTPVANAEDAPVLRTPPQGYLDADGNRYFSRIKQLRISKNDFSEPLAVQPDGSDSAFARYFTPCLSQTGRKCIGDDHDNFFDEDSNLKFLHLRKTRLSEGQLTGLMKGIEETSGLIRVSLQGVSLPECFVNWNRKEENPLFRALSRSGVTYCDISARLEYFDLHKKLIRTIRDRETRRLRDHD